MEVINGGYGIKNPLLSPDIHIQPVSVDETITGNNKNAPRKFRFLCFYYIYFLTFTKVAKTQTNPCSSVQSRQNHTYTHTRASAHTHTHTHNTEVDECSN